MAFLDWSYQGLTDSQLLVKLRELSEDITYREVNLSGNCLHSLPDLKKYRQFQNLVKLDVSYNEITTIDQLKLSVNIQELKMHDNRISEMCDLSGCQNLVKLNVSNNKLTAIDLLKLPENIQELNMMWNEIRELCDLNECQNLVKLNVSCNKLTTIDQLKLPVNIQELEMEGNGISELCDLSECQNLAKLDVSYNKLITIDQLKLPVNIQELEMHHNRVSEWSDLSGCQNLVKLDVSYNKLTAIDQLKLPVNIQELEMHHNEINKFYDLSECQNLVKLDVSYNNLMFNLMLKLPVNIQELKMHHNYIIKLCDLSGYQNLVKLDVSHNMLTDIDPSEVPLYVEWISLKLNVITKVCDWSGHKKLKYLGLGGTKITEVNPANTDLTFLHADTFGYIFFKTADGYTHLKRCHFNTEHLHEPPQDVFHEGMTSIKTYFKNKLSEKSTDLNQQSTDSGYRSRENKHQESELPVIESGPFIHSWLAGDDETESSEASKEGFYYGIYNTERRFTVSDETLSSTDEQSEEQKSGAENTTESMLEYEISSKAASLFFPEENITVEIPPNSLPAHVAPCRASVSPEECLGSHLKNAMSKVYEFSPSGLTTQNNIMFVIPLFNSHQYDYDNMTLMYQQDEHYQFVDADDMKLHKPTWLFCGDKCYVFPNHFCKMHVAKKKDSSGRKVKSITLESLLFYKKAGKILELVTTFGCYNEKSVCSTKEVKRHYEAQHYKVAYQQQAIIFEDSSFTVVPEFSADDWDPKYTGDGREERHGSSIVDMCTKRKPGLTLELKHKLIQLQQVTEEKKDVCTCLIHEGQSITLTCDLSQLPALVSLSEEPEGTAWLQNFDCVELKEIIYQHMSHENMLSCSRIMKVALKSDMDPRDFTRFFIHHFIERYHGPKDIVRFVKSLITYLGTYPFLKELVPKLEWLKAKINLKRIAFFLCEEDEMSRFPDFISTVMPRHKDDLQMDQFPDIKTKLLYLMTMVLHNPRYYQILQEFCESRSALRKYVSDDVEVKEEVMLYDRQHCNLKRLCSNCLLTVSQETLKLQPVIMILQKIGKDFTSCLCYKIITSSDWQEIHKSTDAQALGLTRDALSKSLDPTMMDKILRVLYVENMGKEQHAKELQKYYHEQINSHEQCDDCTSSTI